MLFLNKCDLLREKLRAGVQLKNHLVTYGDRPNDYESVSKCECKGKSLLDLHLSLDLDLRNKFGQLHKQNTPAQDRELFSA